MVPTPLSNEETGIPTFHINEVEPSLSVAAAKWSFVAITLHRALIVTNFANKNAAMAVTCHASRAEFLQSARHQLNASATGVILMVFVAMLTPAASPHAGMMHGMKKIHSTKEILAVGFPICILALVLYIFVGYPLCKTADALISDH